MNTWTRRREARTNPLYRALRYLTAASGRWQTAGEVAAVLDLPAGDVVSYLEYLVDKGFVKVQIAGASRFQISTEGKEALRDYRRMWYL